MIKKIKILKMLKKKPKTGCITWELNLEARTNDARARISELIRCDGIKIRKENDVLEDGTVCKRYILADPSQPEIEALLTRYSK